VCDVGPFVTPHFHRHSYRSRAPNCDALIGVRFKRPIVVWECCDPCESHDDQSQCQVHEEIREGFLQDRIGGSGAAIRGSR
jgi:hypothetical protein